MSVRSRRERESSPFSRVSVPSSPQKNEKLTESRPCPRITWHSCSSKHQRATEGCRQRAQKRGPPRHGPGSQAPLAVSLRTSSVASPLRGKDAVLCTGGLPTRGEPMSYVLRCAFRVLRPVEAGRGPSPPDLGACISRPRSRHTERSLSYLPAHDWHREILPKDP